jgi:hypothetical protein
MSGCWSYVLIADWVHVNIWYVRSVRCVLQLAIDGGRFRTGDGSLFAGGPDIGAILAAAADVAAAMAYLHSQVPFAQGRVACGFKVAALGRSVSEVTLGRTVAHQLQSPMLATKKRPLACCRVCYTVRSRRATCC